MPQKPYVYVDTYGSARDWERNAPQGARVAVHYPELGRTVELMTDARGHWNVTERPAPGHGGQSITVGGGELRADPHPPAPVTLADVHALMSGRVWSSDTTQEIAELLIRAGFTIDPPEA